MKIIAKLFLGVLTLLSVANIVLAQTTLAQPASGTAQAAESQVAVSEGEVRKVDVEAGKITIRHGELKSLDMPAMTMVFRAQDTSVLSTLKVGDKIAFVPEKQNGQFVATKIMVKK
ncbi:MAG: copper-binding protein [Pseudomonadota bacterium]